MNDAISRSAAVDIVEMLDGDMIDEFDSGYNSAVKAAVRRLRSIPAIDVAPVVHEQWIEACCGKVCICSRCGKEFDYTCNEIKDEWLFCPKCGAKMDAEEDPDVG